MKFTVTEKPSEKRQETKRDEVRRFLQEAYKHCDGVPLTVKVDDWKDTFASFNAAASTIREEARRMGTWLRHRAGLSWGTKEVFKPYTLKGEIYIDIDPITEEDIRADEQKNKEWEEKRAARTIDGQA